jgi:hypothetical protein
VEQQIVLLKSVQAVDGKVRITVEAGYREWAGELLQYSGKDVYLTIEPMADMFYRRSATVDGEIVDEPTGGNMNTNAADEGFPALTSGTQEEPVDAADVSFSPLGEGDDEFKPPEPKKRGRPKKEEVAG